jgi:hypothetical protein
MWSCWYLFSCVPDGTKDAVLNALLLQEELLL